MMEEEIFCRMPSDDWLNEVKNSAGNAEINMTKEEINMVNTDMNMTEEEIFGDMSSDDWLREMREDAEKEGIKTGRLLGKEEGFHLGIEEGKRREKNRIIKKLLEKNMNFDEISEITGVSKKKIKNLNLKNKKNL